MSGGSSEEILREAEAAYKHKKVVTIADQEARVDKLFRKIDEYDDFRDRYI